MRQTALIILTAQQGHEPDKHSPYMFGSQITQNILNLLEPNCEEIMPLLLHSSLETTNDNDY